MNANAPQSPIRTGGCGYAPRPRKAPQKPRMGGLCAVLVGCLLAGCTVAYRDMSGSVLWARESYFAKDGSVRVVEGPDKGAMGSVIGGVATIWTGSPWGVIAGAGTQIGESAAAVLAAPADIITSGPAMAGRKE